MLHHLICLMKSHSEQMNFLLYCILEKVRILGLITLGKGGERQNMHFVKMVPFIYQFIHFYMIRFSRSSSFNMTLQRSLEISSFHITVRHFVPLPRQM